MTSVITPRVLLVTLAAIFALVSHPSNAGSIAGTLGYDGPEGGGGRPGNMALALDGDGDYVLVDSIRDLSGPEITIAYWYKGSRHLSIVRQQRQFGFFWIVGGYGGQHILSNDGQTNGISAGEGLNDGNWHHVVMTWKQNTAGGFASYLDGEMVASRDSSEFPLGQ